MKQHNLEGEPRPYLIEYSERLKEIYKNRKEFAKMLNLFNEEHGKYRDIEEFINEDSIAAFEAQVEEKEEAANEEELS